ncbi:MAG TPA: DNA-binding domain-containing protein [Burkholderiales bacterium]|nr:DNA-binding domain-containing protein [Burkholderiales bacterium]
MSALARLQRGFQSNVLQGDRRFEHQVAGTARVSAACRLAIYSGAYRARLVEALGKDYPGLRALAGQPRFERLANEYIAACPSSFPNLRWYGGELAAFLGASGHRRAAALAEMAAFEWQLGLAFDAADAAPLTTDDIAGVPPEEWPRMRFRTHPSVRRLSLRYNVPAIRSASEDGAPLPRLERGSAPIAWLIWRQDLTARFRSLEGDEARAFDALMRGADFGEICAELGDSAEPALRAAALLKGWTADGLLAGL